MIKFINFLSTPSYNHHKRINNWYRTSCSAIAILLASLSIVSAQQIHRLHALKYEYNAQLPLQKKADELTEQYTQLSKQQTELLEKTEEWEKYTHRAKRPSNVLSSIRKNSEDSKVTSLRIVRQSVRFQMNVRTAQDGMRIAQNVSSATLFNNVKISSFKTEANGSVTATAEGSIKTA